VPKAIAAPKKRSLNGFEFFKNPFRHRKDGKEVKRHGL